jgi:hypothetical protein
MNESTKSLEHRDEDILCLDVSDAALEAAAGKATHAAASFPDAPTVSLLVVCCGNEQINISDGAAASCDPARPAPR